MVKKILMVDGVITAALAILLVYFHFTYVEGTETITEPGFLFDLEQSGNTLLYAMIAAVVSLGSFLALLILKRKNIGQ
jgi:hypothetical protein